jgi:uncharacterized protein involved in outer membrane biogenesis
MEFTRMLKNVWIRRLLWATGVWLALWALAWLALPPLLKSQVESRGSAALGRALTIGAIDFKPWTLELSVSDVRIATADGKSSQLAIKRLYADAAIQSLLHLAPVVDAITIEQPQLALTHLGDGHYDIDDVLQRLQSTPDTPSSGPARFALYNLVLNDGAVVFTDHIGGAERVHSLRQLNLALPFLSSFDSQREVTVQPRLAFELNGSAFDSGAQATPFAPDAKGDATLQVTHLDMAPYLPYLPASLPVRLKAAVLDSSLKLAFAKEPVRKLVISGALKVSGLKVDDKAGALLLAVDAVQAEVTEFRLLEQIVTLSKLTVTSPNLAVNRNAAGVWNVATGAGHAGAVAVPPVPASSAAGVQAEAKPVAWQVAVDHFILKDGRVRLSDASVAPAVQLALNDTQVEVQDVHWPLAKQAVFEASASLQAPSVKDAKGAKAARPARLMLKGAGTDVAGSATLKLADGDVGLAAPYLSRYLLPRASGVLEGELAASWKDSALQLQAPRLALHDFAMTPPAGNADIRARDLPSFKLLEASHLAIDLQRHAVSLGQLALRGSSVRLARAQDGQWMYTGWLVPAKATPAAPARAPAASGASAAMDAKPAPWTLALAELALDDGTLSWVDRVPAKPVFLELSALQTRIKNLTLEGKKPVPLSLSAKVRSVRTEAGSLRFDGSLMWDPLLAQGTLEARQFPAQALAPYGMGHLHLDLLRADTSFKGQVRYAALAAGPEVQAQGDGSVEELRLNSALKSASGEALSEELLTWKALSLPGIDFTMSPAKPLRLKLREVSLSDFFARLIVNPEGRLVLQDLARAEDGSVVNAGATASQGAASAPAAPQVAASAPAAAAVAKANDPVIEVGTIRLVNGHVAFSDRFIKPNYSADLTELSGSLSRFSSQPAQGEVQMADLELHGRAEGTASLEIAGKLNPLAKPLALDINAKVRDLELSPLSSYAIKYAGYGIERGRLSVDLHYTVNPDGQLQASNKIILNQLVFGEPVAGSSSSLPVKLAVALLADSNGVIDLDVPLSGSLNDPQFRVWPIVWKVIGNVITKALTSPFSLISGLTGGSQGGTEELAHVAFDTGTANISTAALPGLDKVAQALLDKNSLRLTLEGTASLERERDAMQRARLSELLLAEKRRQAASAAKDVTAVAAVSTEEYPTLLQAVYKRANLKKPRNLLGLSKDLPTAEMEVLLLASLPVDEDTVRQLALSRSLAVREYLTRHQVPSERLFLGVVNTAPPQADWQPRVELSIESR